MTAAATLALALHGHFYQPPRDDPAAGEIPREEDAAPYHDWNERIAAECYRPNAELGNFRGLSFDVGPTLLDWLERHEPDVHRRIVTADGEAQRRYGAGNALAQAYHHTILPLATRREKEAEVAWGIADFRHRFGRAPRGLWLPETATDLETLEVLAEAGIELTVLAPWQAANGRAVDPGRPCWVELSAGRRMAVFFFHRELSALLSFDPQATADADAFAARLVRESGLGEAGDEKDRLLLLASDGELYGHHQEFRDLFLKRLLRRSAAAVGLEAMPSLAAWLDRHPPRRSTGLEVPTSWSCHHGVNRWRDVCPCTPQATWKKPFRAGLVTLAAELDRAFLQATEPLVHDPFALTRRWIEVLLGRESPRDLMASEARRTLTDEEVDRLSTLLEAQRLRLRMFSSCGWYHADFDRLEPANNLAAARHAVELTRRATGVPIDASGLREIGRTLPRPAEARSSSAEVVRPIETASPG